MHVTVTPNLDIDPWIDLHPTDLVHNGPNGETAKVERVGVLPGGMQSGKATVELLLRMPDGQPLIAETSLALFRMVAAAVLNCPVAQMEDL